MNRKQFEVALQQLEKAPKRKNILLLVLAGRTDTEMASACDICTGTVRKHRERLYKAFEIKTEFPGDRRSKRGQLVELFEKFQPELVKQAEDPVLDPSPFITGTPITQPRYFFGREKELKRLFNLLKRHPLQNAAIIGKSGSGKTSVLHYLKNITTTPAKELRPGQKSDWLPHPENYRWIFVDFQDPCMASRERLLAYILECLGLEVPSPCDLDRFMDEVSGKIYSPTVILLDEIGQALDSCQELNDELWNCFRSWACNSARGNLAFVLTTPKSPVELAQQKGRCSPFFNIFGYTATLGPLKESEALSLIASSPIPFPDEDVEWILQKSRCWPLLLQILCRECLQGLSDGETEWRSEGLRQIEPFARKLQIGDDV